ncbi:caspase family protein [Nostoc sp.]|uniref:caspase family protein n=1 Tax=Nostoc sp. TaxID=1180 RepID=UPI002FFBB44D
MPLSKIMNIKNFFFTTLTGVTLLLIPSAVAQTSSASSSTSSRIIREAIATKRINWGLRQDSPPISFKDPIGGWEGFCTNLTDLLDKYLREKQFINNDINIVRYPISIQDRFKKTRYPYQDSLHLAGECGSDSIRKNETGITFSHVFYATKTLLLIRKTEEAKFSFLKTNSLPNFSSNSKPKIGVINTSITPDRLQSFFNSLLSEMEIVNIQGGRSQLIDALVDKRVDAVASDEIILRRILKELDLETPNEFYIDSELVISYETYGLILPSDDSKWVQIINDFFINKKYDIQLLTQQYIIPPSPPSLFTKELIFTLLMIIATLSGLSWVGYMYWVRRQNFRSEIKPNLDPKTPIFANGYALLIGVGESDYQPLSLPVTVKDIQALHQVLVDPNFCAYPNNRQHIRLLHDQEATRSKILEQLNWLKQQAEANPEATVVVYYSGHGWFSKSQNSYYLLPHDINPFDLESSSLSAEDFTNALRQIKSQRLLVIVDSCHAAGMATAKKAPSDFKEIPIPESVINDLSQGKGRVVFTSSQGEESSWIRPDKQMSIYTYHLIEAMKGEGNQAHENFVKISHLMKHLSHQVPVSARTLCQEEQTPYFSVEAEDFPIALLKGRRPKIRQQGVKSD